MVLARAKLEQLVSMTWSVRDVGGTLVFSTDESLTASRAGEVDYLDAHGQSVGSGGGAAYVRRWSIERRGSGAAELLIVQVTVTTVAAAAAGRGDRDAVWISGARLRRGA
jgi:hypothetical protein